MEPITFSRQVDFKTFIKLYLQKVLLSTYSLAFYTAAFFALFLAYYGFELPNGELTLFTVVTIVIMVIFPLRLYSRAKRQFDSTASAGEESFWEINEQGVDIKNSRSAAHYDWSIFAKVTVDKDWVFLWYNNMRYTFFSKRVVSPSQIKEIKRFIFINKKSSV